MQDQLAANDPLTATPPPASGPHLLLTCAQVADRLGESAAGELLELERVGVGHHLGGCTACRQDAAEYRDLLALAGSLPPARPSPAAEARILAALRAAG